MGTTADPSAPRATPRHWFEGDAFRTRFLESMSLLAPEAERFFIGTVRERLDGIADPALRARCAAFIREEGEHSLDHHRFNARLGEQGLDPAGILRPVRALTDAARRWLSRDLRLAVTAAGEHVSAVLSRLFLETRAADGIRDATARALYLRHAREELGHRDVAYDLLQACGVGYASRIVALLAVSLATPLCVVWVVHRLLAADAPRWRHWLRGLPWLLGLRGGFLVPRTLVAGYLRYFRPGFHPGREMSVV